MTRKRPPGGSLEPLYLHLGPTRSTESFFVFGSSVVLGRVPDAAARYTAGIRGPPRWSLGSATTRSTRWTTRRGPRPGRPRDTTTVLTAVAERFRLS